MKKGWKTLIITVVLVLIVFIPFLVATGSGFRPSFWELINMVGGSSTLLFGILCMLLWLFKDLAIACPKKPNGWQKVYKFFHLIHIPCGAIVMIFGLYHFIWAAIQHQNAQFFTWGKATYYFFFLGFIAWLLRKPLKNYWLILHRTFSTAAMICMVMHIVPAFTINYFHILPSILGF